jgi:hypothetical protein
MAAVARPAQLAGDGAMPLQSARTAAGCAFSLFSWGHLFGMLSILIHQAFIFA